MPLGNHIKYKDIITGATGSNLDKLPCIKRGYDSYLVNTPKPEKLINKSNRGIARFLPALPIKKIPFTLGEGFTPLIPSKVFNGVYIKNEGLNPTGNFKDRESALALAYAKEQGYKNLAIASSGNAALSAALYARIYGINITCYIPNKTPRHKTHMIDLFGARTHIVGDTYEECYHYLLDNMPKGSINITSGMFPLRSDGTKTISYEIWEDLGKAPDVVICPAGNGSAIAAIHHGFSDLKNWGLIDKVPAMVCVQIKGADPINQAILHNEWLTILEDIPDSQCEAIVANESFCSPKAVHAIKKSGGFGISVTDHQVIDGLRFAIDSEGIFPEFSSASAFSVMLTYADKIKEKGPTIVIINSATGLKELQSLREILNGDSGA
jgi:threonine synthase